MALDDARVYIRRQWNDKKIGVVPFDQLYNPHWDDISGDRMQRAPRPFIHGYVWWSDAQDPTANGVQWIQVCVVKKDNNWETFERLLEIVGPRPKWKMGEHWP